MAAQPIVTIETYIRSWLYALTGLNAIPLPQNCPEPTRAYLTFYIYGETQLGQDFIEKTTIDTNGTLYGKRELLCRISCFCNCRPITTGTFIDPREVLRKVRASIYNDSTIDFFKTYNLVLNDSEQATIDDISFKEDEDSHWIHAAETEVIFTAQYEETVTQYNIKIVNIDGSIEPNDLTFESEITL
jgi:hypothetical protein